jgi:pyruvyltransferase
MLKKYLPYLNVPENQFKAILLSVLLLLFASKCNANPTAPYGLPLYYWQQPNFVNFGDYISLEIVQRILGNPVRVYKSKPGFTEKRLLAVGSLLFCAKTDDVIWGSGTNGKRATKNDYSFTRLDVRAVRGPLTRAFLMNNYNISCPEIYGDPALLMPYLFPEFKPSQDPKYDYIIIPHYAELKLFPRESDPKIVYPTDHWKEIILKILDSKFVISSSLHGVIVAEAFGIPARYLRATEKEPLLKYIDYYTATNRPLFNFATTVEEALLMGGEPPIVCDLEALYDAFPFEFWPETTFVKPDFSKITQN